MATSRFSPQIPGLAAALVPLAFGPWLRDTFVLPKLAAAALFAALSLAELARRGSLGALRSRVDGPLAAFCAAALLSSLRSIDARLSWYGHYSEYLFSMAGLAGCVAAFYAGCALEREGRSASLLRWLVLGSLPVSLYACAQGAGWEFFPGSGVSLPMGRGAISSWGSPVFLGAYLSLIIPLALAVRLDPSWRRPAEAALALAVCALALTASRGAWLAAAAGAAVYSALRGKKSRRLVLAALAAGALLACAAATRWRAGAADSDSGRLAVWRIAADEARERPWIGWGMDTFVVGFRQRKGEALARASEGIHIQSHAHNDWLQVLVTMGLVGVAAYAWLHIRALRALGAAPAAAGAVVAVLVLAKFNSPSFGAAWLAALLAGTALSAPRERTRLPLAPALMLLSTGWFCVAAGTLTAADREDLLGRRARAEGLPREALARFDRAAAWNPGAVRYRFDLVNTLWDAADAVPAGDRRVLLDAAVETAQAGVRARPLDAEAHRLLGLARLRSGAVAAARFSLENALSLDPYYRRTLEELVRVCSVQGDAARKRELEERLRRIS